MTSWKRRCPRRIPPFPPPRSTPVLPGCAEEAGFLTVFNGVSDEARPESRRDIDDDAVSPIVTDPALCPLRAPGAAAPENASCDGTDRVPTLPVPGGAGPFASRWMPGAGSPVRPGAWLPDNSAQRCRARARETGGPLSNAPGESALDRLIRLAAVA